MKRERVSSFRKHGTCLGRMKVFYRWGLGSLCAILLALLSSSTALADNIFVANGISGGTIGEYTTSGATVNAALISGLSTPVGIAVSGSNLFVTNAGFGPGTGRIGEYTTSGAPVNPALISGLNDPQGIAVSGSNLFVTIVGNGTAGNGTIGEYTTSGATVNAALISGLNTPTGIAIIPSTVPEPATLTLLGLGLIGLMGLRRKDAQ